MPALALPQEPESVSPGEQARQTAQAQADAHQRAMDEWWPYRQLLLQTIDNVEIHPWARRQRDELRVIRRSVERITRTL